MRSTCCRASTAAETRVSNAVCKPHSSGRSSCAPSVSTDGRKPKLPWSEQRSGCNKRTTPLPRANWLESLLACETGRLQELWQQTHAILQEIAELTAVIRRSHAARDYDQLLPQVLRLRELCPHDVKLARLLDDLQRRRNQQETVTAGQRLQEARERVSQGDYTTAADRLIAIPAEVLTPDQRQLYHEVRELSWISSQLKNAPATTPQLAAIAQRLVELQPKDARGALERGAGTAAEGASCRLTVSDSLEQIANSHTVWLSRTLVAGFRSDSVKSRSHLRRPRIGCSSPMAWLCRAWARRGSNSICCRPTAPRG